MEESPKARIDIEGQDLRSQTLGMNFRFRFSGDSNRRLLNEDDAEDCAPMDEDYDEDEYYACLAKNCQAEEFKALPGGLGLRDSMRRKEKERQKRSPGMRIGDYDSENDSVFDERTKLMVRGLILENALRSVDSLLHSGGAANLYVASGLVYNYRVFAYQQQVALKIFISPKIDDSTPMNLRGGSHAAKKQRHLQLRKSAEREFENLSKARIASVAPNPLFVHEHIVAMEFVGSKHGKTAPLLRTARIHEHYPLSAIFIDVIEKIRLLYHWSNLVHGRLGDDNILLHNGSVCFLDFCDAIDRSDPKHTEALNRDLEYVRKLFARLGLREDDEKWALWSLDTMKQFVTSALGKDAHGLLRTCSHGWRVQKLGYT